MSNLLCIVVSRKASDYLKPGNVTGYQCHICSEELQVSPTGVGALAKGAIPLCNSCGFALKEFLEQNPHLVVEHRYNLVAMEQLMQRLRSAQNN